MALVQYPPRVGPVGRQVIRHETGDLVVPPDLQYLIEYTIHSLPSLLLAYRIDVVEDDDRVRKLLS